MTSHRFTPAEIAHICYDASRTLAHYDHVRSRELSTFTVAPSWSQLDIPDRAALIDTVRRVMADPSARTLTNDLTGILVTNIIRILATGREPMAVSWLEHEAELVRRGAAKLLDDCAAAGADVSRLERDSPVVNTAVQWTRKQAEAHGVPVEQIEVDGGTLLTAARKVLGIRENPPAPEPPGDLMDRVGVAQTAVMQHASTAADTPVATPSYPVRADGYTEAEGEPKPLPAVEGAQPEVKRAQGDPGARSELSGSNKGEVGKKK